MGAASRERRKGGSRRRTWWWAVPMLLAGLVATAVYQAGTVHASSGGIAGYSGNPATNGGAGCDSCHRGGVAPAVTLSGPTTVNAGETHSYTLIISGGQEVAGGLDVSVTGGSLAAIDAGTRLDQGEITHIQPRAVDAGGVVSWTFSWTAPVTGGAVIVYGAGNSVDLRKGRDGDMASTASLTITVEGGTTNEGPIADAGGPYSAKKAAQRIRFDASGSFDPDGTIVSYEWDFGDGATGSGERPTHQYAGDGIYTVTLTVTDEQGARDSDVTTATVGGVTNQPPQAAAGGPYTGTAGEGIQFDGTASTDPENGPLSYQWDFGDGAAGSGATPTHTYSAAGTYTVTLTVTDQAGLTAADATQAAITAVDGAQVYAARCAGCHGADGSGGAGPSLQVSTLSLTEIVNLVTAGQGTMPGFAGTLSGAEIDGVAAHAHSLQTPGATTTTTLPPSASGAEVYAARCAGCHGADGSGGFGPSLQVSTLSLAEIINLVAVGQGSMPGFAGTLSASHIDAVAVHAHGLQSPGATTTTTTSLPPSASGAEIYAAKCAGCHRADGSGGIGPALAPTELSATEMVALVSQGRDGMPAFGEMLPPDQIEAVVAFVLGLEGITEEPTEPSGGAAEMFVRYCAGCHGGNGEPSIAPDLARSELSIEELTAVITYGRGAMPAWTDRLTAGEIASLARYVAGLEAGSTGETTTTALPVESQRAMGFPAGRLLVLVVVPAVLLAAAAVIVAVARGRGATGLERGSE